MTIGEHIALLRKRKSFSQASLGKKVGTSGDIIGRYERGVITPSIEVIIKIADTLEVSIDFLVGKTSLILDNDTLQRLNEIDTLSTENKKFVFNMLDMALRDFKTKQSYAI